MNNRWAVLSIYGLDLFETYAEAKKVYDKLCDEFFDNAIEIGSWPYDADNTVRLMKIERIAHPVEPSKEEVRKGLDWHWKDEKVTKNDN